MAHEVTVPRLGWSMEEGTFVRWLKRDGEFVRRGEAIFELEGEKALQEIEAVDEGILRIPPGAPSEGSVVPVGKVLGYLVAQGEALSVSTGEEANRPSLAEPATTEAPAHPVARGIASESKESSDRIVASPRARRIAKELSVDWSRLQGSGTGGRIRECDVRAAAGTNAPTETRVRVSRRRRSIAERLSAARQHIVPVTLTTRADATQLVARRERCKSSGSAAIPSFQDILIKLAVETLQRHPLLAGRWDGDVIVLPTADGLHIGFAVDTDEGLLVPVLRDVGNLTIDAIAKQSRQLIEQARAGKLSMSTLQGGVFTITNLGAFGIDEFTPVINYPESAILGLGAIRRVPVVLEDGRIVAQQQITLSLTFDHRVVDGAPAARFLQDIVTAIEGV